MRYLLVLTFVAVAYAGSLLPGRGLLVRPMSTKIDDSMDLADLINSDGEIDLVSDAEEGTVEAAPMFIVSWRARRALRKMQKQMPCGWPQYGIPPLAPLKRREAEINFKEAIWETKTGLTRLLVEGLNDFKIKKFKVNVIFSKVTFDFLFKNIQMSAQEFDTDTLVDVMQQLGLSVQFNGDGSLGVGMKNVRVAGTLKYKIPILWGSIKITSLKTDISVQSVNSNITGSGILGVTGLNRLINDNVEKYIESMINNNRAKNSDLIEDNLVPRINKQLKGNDLWTLIDMIFSSVDGENDDDPIVTKCEAPEDPWN